MRKFPNLRIKSLFWPFNIFIFLILTLTSLNTKLFNITSVNVSYSKYANRYLFGALIVFFYFTPRYRNSLLPEYAWTETRFLLRSKWSSQKAQLDTWRPYQLKNLINIFWFREKLRLLFIFSLPVEYPFTWSIFTITLVLFDWGS